MMRPMPHIAPETIASNFAPVLKAMRKAKGLSHQDVADMAKVHRSTISLIESGKIMPTLLVCLRIADALDVSLAEMLRQAVVQNKNKQDRG